MPSTCRNGDDWFARNSLPLSERSHSGVAVRTCIAILSSSRTSEALRAMAAWVGRISRSFCNLTIWHGLRAGERSLIVASANVGLT